MKKKTHSVDIVFMLVLFSIFAVMSVLLILIGSSVYGKITDTQETNGNNRTVLAYITNKVRACQVDDGVYIEEKDGIKVLVIETTDGTDVYEILIYASNGKLKEATVEAGDDYTLEFGDTLAEVSEFNVEINQVTGILTISVDTEGKCSSADVYTGK